MKILLVMLVTFLAVSLLPSGLVAKPLPPRPKAAVERSTPAGKVVVLSCMCITPQRTWPCEVQGKMLVCRP